jgi:integrase
MNELIEHHLRWCRAGNLAARTIHERRRVLEQADRELPMGIEASTKEEIEAWLGNPGWKPGTRKCYYTHLHEVYRWATAGASPILDYDPMSELRRPKAPRGRPRPVAPDVLADVLARAIEPYRTFVLLAAALGLRCKEIALLRREDVTSELVTLREAKGGDVESVPCHPAVWDRVRDMPAGSIVETVGGVADPSWVSIRTALYFRNKLRMPGVALHRFRHTYGTALRRQGHDLFLIKALMRHRSIESTQIYVDVGNEERLLAVAALPIPTPAPR